MSSMSNIKIVNIGDSGVGKTCVLISYCDNEFPSEHVPTAFDNYSTIIEYNERPYSVGLWDTSGQDNDTMRPLSYADAKVFLIFFSLVDRKSFERVESKWVPELQKYKVTAPYIIIGNKLDLRNDKEACKKLGVNPITTEEGLALAKKVKAAGYRECSAKTQEGLGEVFQLAVTAVVEPDKLSPKDSKNKDQKKKKKFLGIF